MHHLDAPAKQELFRRVADVLRDDGAFVLADVVVPERVEDVVTPIDGVYDLPDTVADQLAWLRDAGFDCEVVWAEKDLAVVRSTRRRRRG